MAAGTAAVPAPPAGGGSGWGSGWDGQAVTLIVLSAEAGGFSGFFVYSPSPGPGNLIGSWAAAAGIDPYGNAYPAGLNVAVGSISGTVFNGTDFTINSQGLFFYEPGTANPAFGIDNAVYPNVIASMGVASVAAYRGNNTPAQNVPASWPGPGTSPIPAGVLYPCIGFKPGGSSTAATAMAAVLAGTYDAAISAYFASIVVPAGGAVYQTSWHEGETDGVPAATLIAYHQHVYSLFKASAPAGAFYGQCFTAFTANPSSSHYPVPQWVSCVANGGAADLDFYAVDGYQPSNTANTPAQVMGPWLSQLQTKVPAAKIAVFENNVDSPNTDAPAWFADAWAWAIANSALVFNIFYAAGTWTGDPATTAELVAINNASGSGSGTHTLIASIAPEGGTDQYGNLYLAGICSYGSTANGPDFSQLLAGQLSTGLISDTTPAGISGGQGAAILSSGAKTILASVTELSVIAGETGVLDGWAQLSSNMLGLYMQQDQPALGNIGGWNPMSLGNGWSNSGAGPEAEYRLLPSPGNSVQITGDLNPGTVADGTVIATLPAGYRPLINTQPVQLSFAGTAPASGLARMSVNTSGQLQCEGLAGLPGTARVLFNQIIPLDA